MGQNHHLTKIILITLVFVAISGGVVAYFFMWSSAPVAMITPQSTPSPDPTKQTTPNPKNIVVDISDWETYRNDKYRYYIKYPNVTSIQEDIHTSKDIGGPSVYLDSYLGVPANLKEDFGEIIQGGKGVSLSFIRIIVLVQKINNPDNLSINDWLNIYRSDIIKSATSQRNITFQGVPAYHLERDDRGLGKGLYAYNESTIYFFRGDNLFSVRSIEPPLNPAAEWKSHPYYQYLEKSVPITEAIINSFRFVE